MIWKNLEVTEIKTMNGSKFVDTNVLIRIWEGKPEFVGWLENISTNGKEVCVPSVVIAEVVWVLTSFYKKSREEIKDFIETIGNTESLKIVTKHDIVKAISLYENSKVKFTDCMIAGYLGENDVIVSEDRDFDKLDGVKREDVSSQLS